jgi:hypothetical protein
MGLHETEMTYKWQTYVVEVFKLTLCSGGSNTVPTLYVELPSGVQILKIL